MFPRFHITDRERRHVDVFSASNFREVRVVHMELDLRVMFSSRTLQGAAVLHIALADDFVLLEYISLLLYFIMMVSIPPAQFVQ